MSKQGTIMIRLLFIFVAATFLIAVGGGVFAQNTDDAGSSQADLAVPTSTSDRAQDAPRNGKPLLTGGVPSEPPPFVTASSPVRGATSVDFQSSPNAPTITIWYDATQKAGAKGDPQKWVNVVGSVTPKPSLLTYSLNNGPTIALRTGPDPLRLAKPGDFNIDLDYTELKPGANQVKIFAKDSQGLESQALVTVYYQRVGSPGTTPWTKPGSTYIYNWAGAARIDDLAQVVDGQWELANGGVRPTVLAYDRLIGIGDLSWRDYTVTVPITFTGIDPAGYEWPSNGPAVGVILRWQGHILNPNTNATAPLDGWQRLGTFAFYHWMRTAGDGGYGYSEALRMYRYLGKPDQVLTKARTLNIGTTYNFRVSVQSTGVANPPAIYRFKVWDALTPEPDDWDFEAPGFPGEPASGGVLLVAHHVDAKFGNVTVQLDSTLPPPTLTVNKSGSGSGNVSLSPASQTNTYRFGEDVQLTAAPASGSSFAGWQGGLSGNTNPGWVELFTNQTVTAVFTSDTVGAPVSDDFSSCTLDSRWEFIDPLANSTLTMTGSKAQIYVPAGTSHDMWVNDRNAPRMMQYINNGDFEFDVKFDSSMDSKYQLQGIVVEKDDKNFLRYNFQHDGSAYQIAAYSVLNNVATMRVNQAISISAPMYLRTNRTGNVWTLSYSSNGQNWTQAAQFTFVLEATKAGVFAGNAVQNPAMVSQIDYFFNTGSPIVPQDNARKITVSTTGSGTGTVTRTPQKNNYACNEAVTLEAVPAPDSVFSGWGGDLSGMTNPITVNMTEDLAISANFDLDVVYHTLTVTQEGQGEVAVSPAGSQFPDGTQVSLLATPSAGYRFVGWEGDISGDTNPSVLYMDGDKSVKAVFEEIKYTLDISTKGQGTVAVTPTGTKFLPGTPVSLFASPAPGYQFIRWEGDISGNSNPWILNMNEDKTVEAVFAPLHPLIFFPVVLNAD